MKTLYKSTHGNDVCSGASPLPNVAQKGMSENMKSGNKMRLDIALVVMLMAVGVVRAGQLEGYDFRMKLSVTNLPHVQETQADFPILVKLTASNMVFAHAETSGLDVCFTDADGQSLLAFERERHVTASQMAEYWVKLPSVSSAAQTDFYMYYGGPLTNGAVATNVWNSSYYMVQHLDEEDATGLFLDSTSYSRNLVNINSAIATNAGMIDGGVYFDGGYLASNNIPRPQSGYVAMWMKWNGNVGSTLAYCLLPGTAVAYKLYINAASNVVSHIHTGTSLFVLTGNTTIVPNQWYHVSDRWGRWDTHKLFVDGTLDASDLNKIYPYYAWWNGVQMFGNGFEGVLDEIRISNARPSNLWFESQYYAQKDKLLCYGPEEDFRPQGTLLLIR